MPQPNKYAKHAASTYRGAQLQDPVTGDWVAVRMTEHGIARPRRYRVAPTSRAGVALREAARRACQRHNTLRAKRLGRLSKRRQRADAPVARRDALAGATVGRSASFRRKWGASYG